MCEQQEYIPVRLGNKIYSSCSLQTEQPKVYELENISEIKALYKVNEHPTEKLTQLYKLKVIRFPNKNK